MTDYPPGIRLKDIKDRKGHLCQGGEFSLRDGPVCGCGAFLETLPDLLPPVRDTPSPYGPDEPPHHEDTPDHPRMTNLPRGRNEEPPLVSGDDVPPAPFRHASGEPCYGCQICFAERIDMDHGISYVNVSDLMAEADADLMAEADAMEAPGAGLVAQLGQPDLAPTVPPVDPTMPYGPADIEKAILDAVQRLERGLKHEANLIAATEQLKVEYELAFARSVEKSTGGAADQRKANATLASEPEYRAWHEAMAARDAMKAITHTLRSTLSGLQSVGRSVGVSYQAPQGRGS